MLGGDRAAFHSFHPHHPGPRPPRQRMWVEWHTSPRPLVFPRRRKRACSSIIIIIIIIIIRSHFGSSNRWHQARVDTWIPSRVLAAMPSLEDPLVDEEDDLPTEGHSKLRSVVTIVAIGALLATAAVFHSTVTWLLESFVNWCVHLGWISVALFIGMVAVMNLFMLPTFPLMAGAGVIFPKMFGMLLGQVVGVLTIFFGLWLGSMMAFTLGRSVFKKWAEEELAKYEWMGVINKMVDEQGWWVVMLARMSPLVPGEVFNYACSLTSLDVWSYGIGCLGSIVPVGIWVCSAAAAGEASKEASSQLSPEEKARHERTRAIFIGCNLVFLVALSLVFYFAVQRSVSSLRRSRTVTV